MEKRENYSRWIFVIFVHIVFTASAFYCSWISCKRVKEINRNKEIIVN
jgi:hypothetical protein